MASIRCSPPEKTAHCLRVLQARKVQKHLVEILFDLSRIGAQEGAGA
jgi:hypothetical protein